jgi:hypothetical protein
MMRKGLYAYSATLLDGVVDGDGGGVTVLRDGTICGGNSFFYYNGSCSCSGGKWKGKLTTYEHSAILKAVPFARRSVTVGFSGTYTDDEAEFDAAALLGNRTIRVKVTLRLLMAH